jgi:hypothetical protein
VTDLGTEKALPASVHGAYFVGAEKILGREVGLLYDDLEALPKSFDSEAWWIERGLRA